MNKAEIKARIKLVGLHGDYRVVMSGFDGHADIPVTSYRVGTAIVAALRAEAAKRPDAFPSMEG